jgi:hypothetical protein
MYVPRAAYSLRMSFWDGARQRFGPDALFLGDELVEEQQDRRGSR